MHDRDVRYELSEGRVNGIDATERLVAEWQPIGTAVVQLLALGMDVVLREDYYRFPPGRSNVYCLDPSFSLKWSAELPSITDVYANTVQLLDGLLVCASWEGETCWLDPRSGVIVRRALTK